jgi:hypothetical protein
LEVEFQLSKFFQTAPSNFAGYDFKSFIWQYDRMIEWDKQQNQDPNVMELKNPYIPR